MTRAGAPIRFLAFVLGGWVAMRVALLWPAAAVEALAPAPLRPLAHAVSEALAASARPAIAPPRVPDPPVIDGIARYTDAATPRTLKQQALVTRPFLSLPIPAPAPAPAPAPDASATQRRVAITLGLASYVRVGNPAPPSPSPPRAPSRLSGSAWGIVRGAGSRTAIATPQLGGSQAGVRFAYALGDARRFAATLRLASALGDPDREIAPGIEWRVPGAPIRLFAEQRIALGRNRGGTTAGVIAGISRALPAHFALEGYAQGGVIARDGGEGFADGAVRVDHAVARAGGVDVVLGAGAWGAVQHDASRVDIGPTLAARVPVAGGGLRVAIDWRRRIAGNARPESGPALSVGADF